MSDTQSLSGWQLPNEIVISKTDFVKGHMTLARDSIELVSPVFNDRDEAFEWLKDEVSLMGGNAILSLGCSDLNDENEHWFSGRAALVGKRAVMASNQEALVTRQEARQRRAQFLAALERINEERAERKADQEAWEAQCQQRKKRLVRGAALMAVLLVGSGLVYALPL